MADRQEATDHHFAAFWIFTLPGFLLGGSHHHTMLLARRPTLALPADLLQCMLTSLQPFRTIHASSRSRLSQKPYYVTTPIFYVNAGANT